MISKTKIGKKIVQKNDLEIVETILVAKKKKAWNKVAQIVGGSRKKYSSINLKEIDNFSQDGDTIVVPGKVLSSGNLYKKVKVCAVNFSESAKEKLKNAKIDYFKILEEIEKNPEAKGVKILK